MPLHLLVKRHSLPTRMTLVWVGGWKVMWAACDVSAAVRAEPGGMARIGAARRLCQKKSRANPLKTHPWATQCTDDLKLPAAYNCLATSRGLLNHPEAKSSKPASCEAAASLVWGLKDFVEELSDDPVWVATTRQSIDYCAENADRSLTLGQLAVHHLMCLEWMWYDNCDRQQERHSKLDEAGARRRATFLTAGCPLSPNTLRTALERVTQRSLKTCNRVRKSERDPYRLYSGHLKTLVCLLRKFTTRKGQIDVDSLKGAIISQTKDQGKGCAKGNGKDEGKGKRNGDPDDNGEESQYCALLEIVDNCDGAKTAEQFAKCWAEYGSPSCGYQLTNTLATRLPGGCNVKPIRNYWQ
ncbi:hypothetical protein FJT64_020624 [Amphibalanus amphitrite]|uniref:Uncharacterized protein n=1 Tax=Amphibalanus amphitrite TaxID=1232801 RepID=A0A6A4WL59_AMPAM|nr:hypothetical protein FJT64_020624 [Amphibalanus amphitrite]